METFGNQIMPKLCFKFYCKNCDYGTSKKSSFESHESSSKHQKTAKVNVLETNYAKLCQVENCYLRLKRFKGLKKFKEIKSIGVR
jgi:hypothetical protein